MCFVWFFLRSSSLSLVFHSMKIVSACVMKVAVNLKGMPLLCMVMLCETDLLAIVAATPARVGS